jgi:hypothetical protein
MGSWSPSPSTRCTGGQAGTVHDEVKHRQYTAQQVHYITQYSRGCTRGSAEMVWTSAVVQAGMHGSQYTRASYIMWCRRGSPYDAAHPPGSIKQHVPALLHCSATLTLYGGKLVPYLLDESKGWAMDIDHLRSQLAEARSQGTTVRGLVVSLAMRRMRDDICQATAVGPSARSSIQGPGKHSTSLTLSAPHARTSKKRAPGIMHLHSPVLASL